LSSLFEELFELLEEDVEVLVLLELFGFSSLTSLVLLDDPLLLIGSPNKSLKVSLTGFLALSFVLSELDFEAVGVVLDEDLSLSCEDLDLLDEW